MGVTLSAITRLWTQYRYNCRQKENAKKNLDIYTFSKRIETPEIYKNFEQNIK